MRNLDPRSPIFSSTLTLHPRGHLGLKSWNILRASWIQICKFHKIFLHAQHIFLHALLFTLADIWDQNRGVVFTVFDKRLLVLPNMERRAGVDHESGRISVKFYVDGPFSGSIAGSRLAGLNRESKGNPVFRESHSGRRIYEFTKFVTHAQRIFTPRLSPAGITGTPRFGKHFTNRESNRINVHRVQKELCDEKPGLATKNNEGKLISSASKIYFILRGQ